MVLVTHQLQFLRQTKNILVLSAGEQKAKGSFEEIKEAGFNLDEILNSYGQVEVQNDQETFEAEESSEGRKTIETKVADAEVSKEGPGDLIEKENDNEEKVRIKDLFTYFKYGSGKCGLLTIFLACSLNAAWLMAVLYWISYWSEQTLRSSSARGTPEC